MRPLYPLSDYLKDRYGARVRRVSLNAGLTCPNRDGAKAVGGCVYCESSALIPRSYVEGASIREQLDSGMKRARERYRAEKFIAYFQINSSTYAPIDYLERMFREAASHEDVVALAVSTRPDCVGEDVLDLLSSIKKEKDLWLELGLQSSNNKTLTLINRGHSASDFASAVKAAGQRGIAVCAHVIIGLPGEGRADVNATARFLAEMKIWGVKIHQLQVLKGTELERMLARGEVAPLSLDEYASLVVEFLEELPASTVVHRLSGDAPRGLLIAPLWGAGRDEVRQRVLDMMKAQRTRQGARHNGGG